MLSTSGHGGVETIITDSKSVSELKKYWESKESKRKQRKYDKKESAICTRH